jgi:hypothetical protein
MAALAGAANADKASHVDARVSKRSKGSKGSKENGATAIQEVVKGSRHSIFTIKDGASLGTHDARESRSIKHGPREFMDPRLERLQFLQAVQRMRAQLSEQVEDAPRGDVVEAVSAEIMATRPQRPWSAVARVHTTEGYT